MRTFFCFHVWRLQTPTKNAFLLHKYIIKIASYLLTASDSTMHFYLKKQCFGINSFEGWV